jgi:type IV secretory pathway TraG/TraD family ATPase VirD4
MSPQLHAVTRGTTGLALAYAVVLMSLLAGLIQGRAPVAKLVLSPLLAMVLTVVAGLCVALVSPLLHGLGVARDGWLELAVGVALTAATGYVSGRMLARRISATDASYRRGAVVADAAPPGAPFAGGPGPGGAPLLRANASITLAGLAVAHDDETKHFKIVGTTGTGKSTAIREVLSTALKRGDRAVIADPDGGYLARFYEADRGDLILNPFEPDSVKWNLLGEIANDYDVDQLARSLITDNGDPDRSWNEYARTFFIAVTHQIRALHITDDREVYRLLAKASVNELKVLLGGTAAGPFLEEGNERMFGSVRSTASSAIRVLEYTTRQEGTPFSIRQWVKHGAARRAGGRGGVLFLPYKAGEIAALRSVISAWMRIAIFEAMDHPEGDQRLWFVVDELDALGEIDGLKDALSRLRKFGGRCILGFQSIGQVSGTYGRAVADTVVENCGNTLILRCSASERGGTSEFASKLIGQQQVVHITRSRTRRPTEWLPATTTSEHLSIEPAIMASEIERLPDLDGFLKLASIPDWRRVRLTPVNYPAVARRSGSAVSGPQGLLPRARQAAKSNAPQQE